MSSFVHLHVRTEYSMLEGACRLKDLVKKTKELGMPGVALTDAQNLFGAVEFQDLCKGSEIQSILGCELWVAPGRRSERPVGSQDPGGWALVALCENLDGYRNLCRLVSRAHTEGFFGRPRVDRELLQEHHEGLIFLSGGREGEIDHWLRQNNLDKALETAAFYRDTFGPEHYFLELQAHLPEDREICRQIVAMGKAQGLRTVATNGVRCLIPEDHDVLELLRCISEGKKLSDDDRPRLPAREFHLKSPAEMRDIFAEWPESCDATLEIAGRCAMKIPTGSYFYPSFPLPPGFANDDEYLAHISREGMKARWPEPSPEAEIRLEYELEMMKNMKVAGYMLIVADFMREAREMGIPVGPGRGSAVGSLVAYVTGITDVDPLRYGLLFERFLNPERVSMPDIDSDFSDLDREKIIEYVKRKYGRECVAQIVTYGRMKSKAALTDTARVLAIDHTEVKKLTKLFPPPQAGREASLEEALEKSPQLKEAVEADPRLQGLFGMARRIEGYVRNAGMHAAAVIIAPQEVDHFAPLYCPEDQTDQVVVQYSKDYAEKIGLLKMDFLGLRNLSVIQEACRMIEENHGVVIDPGKLEDGDAKTYALLGRGDTIGVFQFESRGMQDYLRKLMPERLEDLIAMNALYRPGPMEQIPVYIRRKHGQEPVDCYHADLEPALATTYGVMVYQEQVMGIAQKLAGYSLGGADILRRIMGKKDKPKLEKEEPKFIQGAVDRGYPRELAKRIWDKLLPFAEYAFNKSHAAAYAVVAYQTAWLKAHYAAEFLSANMNSELDNTERLVVLVNECRRLRIPVQGPSVQRSRAKFSVSKGVVVYGLAGIKNVGRSVAETIVADREKNGPFADLFDFCKRLGTQALNRRTLESLVMAGAFDELHGNRAQQFHAVPTALQYASSTSADNVQVSLFDMGGNGPSLETPAPELPDVEAWPYHEMLGKEKDVLGMYFSGHPLEPYRDEVEGFCLPISEATAPDIADGRSVLLGGTVRSRRQRLNKDNEQFAFVELEDFSGSVEISFWKDVWAQCREEVAEDRMLLVRARVKTPRFAREGDDNFGRKELEALKVLPLSEARARLTDSVHLTIDTKGMTDQMLERIRHACDLHPGNCRLVMHVRSRGGAWVLAARSIRISPAVEAIAALRQELGHENVHLAARGR